MRIRQAGAERQYFTNCSHISILDTKDESKSSLLIFRLSLSGKHTLGDRNGGAETIGNKNTKVTLHADDDDVTDVTTALSNEADTSDKGTGI